MLSLAACGGSGGGDKGGGGGNTAPMANAGADQTVDELTNVSLTGSGSDANGDTLTYSWTQTAGTQATLNNGDMAQANFDAPDVAPGASETLTFQLTVSDGTANTTDSVDIQYFRSRGFDLNFETDIITGHIDFLQIRNG